MNTQKQKNLVIALSVGILAVVLGGLVYVFPNASNQGFAPEQPIPFSHKIHAGQYKMECRYCHTGVDKSRHAGIPAIATCMNCHTVVKTDSPWIQKIQAAYKSGRPIEWVRVHELPDHVYFPHKRHTAAGLQCETCHGDVREMSRIEQKGALNMGWCINCHKGETTPRQVLARFYPNTKNPHGPVATIQCDACHH